MIDTEWQRRALLSSEPDVGAETQPPGGARPVMWSSGGAAFQQRNRGRGARTCGEMAGGLPPSSCSPMTNSRGCAGVCGDSAAAPTCPLLGGGGRWPVGTADEQPFLLPRTSGLAHGVQGLVKAEGWPPPNGPFTGLGTGKEKLGLPAGPGTARPWPLTLVHCHCALMWAPESERDRHPCLSGK